MGPSIQCWTSGSVHTYLLGYLNSMKYIIVCMVYTQHGIYHLQVYTMGTSHLHPGHTTLYHAMYQKKRYIPWHIPPKLVYTVRQGQVKLVYTMVYTTLTTVYNMVYTKKLVYTMVYTMRQQQVQVPDK